MLVIRVAMYTVLSVHTRLLISISGSLLACYVQSVHLFFGQHVWTPSCLLCTVCPFVISGSLHAWTCYVQSVHLFVMSGSFHAHYVQSVHLFVMSGSLHASYVQSVYLFMSESLHASYVQSVYLFMSESLHASYVQSVYLFMSESLHASYVQSICLCLNPYMLTMYCLSVCLWCLQSFMLTVVYSLPICLCLDLSCSLCTVSPSVIFGSLHQGHACCVQYPSVCYVWIPSCSLDTVCLSVPICLLCLNPVMLTRYSLPICCVWIPSCSLGTVCLSVVSESRHAH